MSLFWLRRPHVPLLALLLAMVATFPWVEDSGIGRCVLSAVSVVGVLWSLRRIRVPARELAWMLAVGSIALVAETLAEFGLSPVLAIVHIGAQGVFYGAAAALMSAYMLGDARATVDELFAAAAAFLLMALAWASVYWLIEHLRPAAFVIARPAHSGDVSWFEFVYFSMSTLSTTGYGDMAPASSGARAAVVIEQFIGVMYVALVISRLAGFAGRRINDK